MQRRLLCRFSARFVHLVIAQKYNRCFETLGLMKVHDTHTVARFRIDGQRIELTLGFGGE